MKIGKFKIPPISNPIKIIKDTIINQTPIITPEPETEKVIDTIKKDIDIVIDDDFQLPIEEEIKIIEETINKNKSNKKDK